MYVFCCKQKTAYEMRISDWSSDVCSSDLTSVQLSAAESASLEAACSTDKYVNGPAAYRACVERQKAALAAGVRRPNLSVLSSAEQQSIEAACSTDKYVNGPAAYNERSEEHTSELQSLMRISYAVLCFEKKKSIKLQIKP